MKAVPRSSQSALLLAAFLLTAVPCAIARAALFDSVWLMDGKVAVQIFDCHGLLCGRILWLQTPRVPQGILDRDKHNPDPALRQRGLCGLTVLWNLQPDGPNRWKDGWFYNPDDGKTYQVTAELTSDDLITVRIYTLLPILADQVPAAGAARHIGRLVLTRLSLSRSMPVQALPLRKGLFRPSEAISPRFVAATACLARFSVRGPSI